MGKQGSKISVTANRGGVIIRVAGWKGLRLGPGRCRVTANGRAVNLGLARRESVANGMVLHWRAPGFELEQRIVEVKPDLIRWSGSLTYRGSGRITLNRTDLWTSAGVKAGCIRLGADPARVRILENGSYGGQVRSFGQIMSGADGRRSLDGRPRSFASEAVTVLDNRALGQSLLIGFESFDRFNGWISGSAAAREQENGPAAANVDGAGGAAPDAVWFDPVRVKPGDGFDEALFGFSCAGIPLQTGQAVRLEEMVLASGPDPDRLLEEYADRVARRYAIHDLPEPFANWCSWYPYRLGVDQDLVVETARQATARHLDELGLRFIQVDLGWERNNLPAFFEENDRFSRGLSWLSRELRKQGFGLGAWKGFSCISERHPVAVNHPDWLVRGKDGKPADGGRWFWEPHDRIFALDVTHPGAQKWLRTQIESLRKRGVRYLKWDFGGNILTEGQRHDPAIACSGAVEGMRLAAGIVHEAMQGDRDGLVLNCTGCETGGLGIFRMIYTNMDTGNTGIGIHHLRNVYTALAAHLFKNRRWGLLQPSCLVVGLPGTVEEARMRATATFLTSGHTDISDDLTKLPEDRWSILLATLPPLLRPARVVDLFHPVRIATGAYSSQCQGTASSIRDTTEPQGPTVWHASVEADWDRWDLVAFFNWFRPEREASGHTVPLRFEVDVRDLGLRPGQAYWAHEFWSGQFLGKIPRPVRRAKAYRHPGDAMALLSESSRGVLSVAFQGPAVKLLVIRRPRSHPWPVATTFHQSGGSDLRNVVWNRTMRGLSGELLRPAGESGLIVIAGVSTASRLKAHVDGRPAAVRSLANHAVGIPVCTRNRITRWNLEVA